MMLDSMRLQGRGELESGVGGSKDYLQRTNIASHPRGFVLCLGIDHQGILDP